MSIGETLYRMRHRCRSISKTADSSRLAWASYFTQVCPRSRSTSLVRSFSNSPGGLYPGSERAQPAHGAARERTAEAHREATARLSELVGAGAVSGMDDHLHSWSPESLPYWGQGQQTAKVPQECQGSQWPMQSMRGWCGFPGNGSDLMDGSVADHAVKVLRELHVNRTTRNDSRPFFMGVSFHKPHMPHWCPQSFFDQYPLEDIQLATNP